MNEMFRQLANENPKPEKARTAYHFFAAQHSQIICTSKRLGLAWMSLESHEKHTYMLQAQQDLKRYQEELRCYKHNQKDYL
jgi:hypothetical protein